MSPQSSKNIHNHELIGIHAEIIESSNPSHVGISGTIVDESRQTVVIQQESSLKRIQKRNTCFMLKLKNGDVKVQGDVIYGRPEDRVKNKNKRRL